MSGSGGGGVGYTRIDVVHLDRSVVVLDFRHYNTDPSSGGIVLLGTAAGVGFPGAAVDWWLNPQILLQALRNLASSGILVYSRMANHILQTLTELRLVSRQ